MSERGLLVVEGQSDVDFFSALLRTLSLGATIDVLPPKRLGPHSNTVTVVPALLPQLIDQLDTGQIHRIGILVDADHHSGGGFLARWDAITAVLREGGYRCPSKPPANGNNGSIFRHNDGLPKVGLWLLPNHHENGMLEDLICSSIVRASPQDSLLTYAQQSIAGLPLRLFSQTHVSKAILYSWLSYQQRPALGLAAPIMGSLLDPSLQPLAGLINWLERTFGGDPLE